MPAAVVVLGASNVARGTRQLLARVQHRFGPCHLFVAAGHGRSYGCRSRVLFRELPGIVHCQLWPALVEPRHAVMHAIITDVGNDIVFGCDNRLILQWVQECLERLQQLNAQVTLARLPTASLRRMTRWQFEVARQLFFPTRRLTFGQAVQQALELDQGLAELAAARNVPTREPPGGWYGWDPIHVRRSYYDAAWAEFLAPSDSAADKPPSNISRPWSLHKLRPYESVRMGRRKIVAQPSLVLPNGTRVSWY